MGISFNITSHSAEVLQALETQKQQALQAVGEKAAETAKGLCPVDTGRLRDSIGYVVKGDGVDIGSDVEYAAAVELGSRKQHPRPYLAPAVEGGASELIETVKRIMSE